MRTYETAVDPLTNVTRVLQTLRSLIKYRLRQVMFLAHCLNPSLNSKRSLGHTFWMHLLENTNVGSSFVPTSWSSET